jgi:UDP-N-acetyl-D-mannosaminuronic acid transferase (WecB/TagA/CpsF family)
VFSGFFQEHKQKDKCFSNLTHLDKSLILTILTIPNHIIFIKKNNGYFSQALLQSTPVFKTYRQHQFEAE